MNKIIQIIETKEYGVLGLSSEGILFKLTKLGHDLVWIKTTPSVNNYDAEKVEQRLDSAMRYEAEEHKILMEMYKK